MSLILILAQSLAPSLAMSLSLKMKQLDMCYSNDSCLIRNYRYLSETGYLKRYFRLS